MTWATWTNSPLVPSIALCSIVFVLWAFDPQVIQVNILFFLAVASLLISLAPDRTTAIVGSLSNVASTLINDYHISGLFITNASMLITGGATVWLLHRALQTLWRPVPELIDILGVEVPAPPDVSLTAIGVDKATITWTKPSSNRAVDKYVIQVNGVNVGESATSNDTFITVSGLKPNHFYNVRIIAVGSNNFQAGSRVLRLRTFGSDGRPRLGTARLPSDFTDDDAASASRQQDNASGNDDNGSGKQFITSVFGGAQSSASEGPQVQSREGPSGVPPSSRRNTINRRHSPSTASLEYQQQLSSVAGGEDESGVDEAQMSELNQKYLNLRRETEEMTGQCVKEEEETKKVLEELEADKRKKRQEQKKKEEQTKKLTKEQNSTDRAMRATQSQRAQKEKKLKEKTAELDRLRENIEKWDRSIKEMQREQESHKDKRAEEDDKYQREANELRENNKRQQAECARLEADLKNVRQAVKELEEGRNALPTAGDDSGRVQIMNLKRTLQRMEADHRNMLNHENHRREGLDAHVGILTAQMQLSNIVAQPPIAIANGGFDYDPTAQNLIKHHTHASNTLSNGAVSSPTGAYAPMDINGLPPSLTPPYAMNNGRPPTQQNYVTGPFMGSSADPQDPEDMFKALSAGAPLTQNLIYSSYNIDGMDGRPPTTSTHASPIGGSATLSEEPSHNARFGLFSPFQRSRGPRAIDEEGPALGTLKHGQSQSFPRQGDDIDGSKHRRSGWSMFSRNSVGPDVNDELFPAAGQINSKTGGLSARSFLPFSTRGNIFGERDASSPRPSSMASIDMPRPSTDSGSIWGPPGDNGAPSSALAKASHLWPADHAWSSGNPSRRQSLHGSPSALRTNLASADDKILDQEELQNPETSPSQVGVIGSKPPAGLRANKSLNPAAPTFMANIFRPKGDKDKDKDHKESKSKGKEKAKDKSKGRDKDKAKGKDGERSVTPAPDGLSPGLGPPELTVDDSSPSAARMSRDGYSVHTQASVADSRESLDYVVSNTASEPNSVGMLSSSKDSESALLKLFRKDSSVKRSLQRISRTKGTGSIASSERNLSVDHRSSFGDYEDLGDESVLSTSGGRRNGLGLPLTSAPSGSVDSVTSSPSVGTSKSRDGKGDSIKIKGTGWFSIKKKNRDKESLDIDRSSLPSPGYANGLGVGLGEPDSTVSSLASMASAASTDDGEKKA
ncbi:fibronectin type iii domain-containing protein [Ophiostoma piceae UAMH 11346]|uniref:Fibronectin type iii domain-containing protein n=1 Tax=Ophiostoma piceae (strain UAMH 11346) TaxID=1262450 RepID=S3C782_OPHP1|nr:fibronectin type iii domain-containing protein [Ophiostoma piceae UAMH 11346]